MKQIVIILMFLAPLAARSQDPTRRDSRLQSLEIAYLTKELNLTPEEAQRFWPVYNKYSDEMRGVIQSNKDADVLDRQQKVLDIRKKYKTEFLKVLSPERVNQMFNAEVKFRDMVRKELQERQAQRKFQRN